MAGRKAQRGKAACLKRYPLAWEWVEPGYQMASGGLFSVFGLAGGFCRGQQQGPMWNTLGASTMVSNRGWRLSRAGSSHPVPAEAETGRPGGGRGGGMGAE